MDIFAVVAGRPGQISLSLIQRKVTKYRAIRATELALSVTGLLFLERELRLYGDDPNSAKGRPYLISNVPLDFKNSKFCETQSSLFSNPQPPIYSVGAFPYTIFVEWGGG